LQDGDFDTHGPGLSVVVTAAPRNPLIADLSTLAAFRPCAGRRCGESSRAGHRRTAVDASEADQALTTTQFATLLEVVWPGSASPIPPVAGTRRGRSSRAAANVAGLFLVREVLLGVVFVLWTA